MVIYAIDVPSKNAIFKNNYPEGTQFKFIRKKEIENIEVKGLFFAGDINLSDSVEISTKGGFVVYTNPCNELIKYEWDKNSQRMVPPEVKTYLPKAFSVKIKTKNAEIPKESYLWLLCNSNYKKRPLTKLAYDLEDSKYKFRKVSNFNNRELPNITDLDNILEKANTGDVAVGDFSPHQINVLAKKGVTCYQVNSDFKTFNIYEVEEIAIT